MKNELINEKDLESFFEKMASLKPGDKDYNTIFYLDYCSNIFCYTKENDDELREAYIDKKKITLDSKQSRLEYYQLLDRYILYCVSKEPIVKGDNPSQAGS